MKKTALVILLAIMSSTFLSAQSSWVKASGLGKQISIDSKNGALWVVGLDNTIWSSTNSGSTWAQVGDGKGIDIAVYNNVAYIIGLDNYIYKYAGTWVKVSETIKGTKICIDQSNGKIAVLGNTVKCIYVSADNGKIWSSTITYVDAPSDIAINKNMIYFVGVNKKLWKSSASATSWSLLKTDFVGTRIAIDAISGAILCLDATNQIFSSADEGKTVTRLIDKEGHGLGFDICSYNNTVHTIGIDNTHWYYKK